MSIIHDESACAGEHTCAEMKDVEQQCKHAQEELFLMTGERNELVTALRKHGQHFGCMLGRAVGGGEEPQGISMDGEPVRHGDPQQHGCTCGLRLLLARYKRVKS